MKKALKWIIGIPVGLFLLFLLSLFIGYMITPTNPDEKRQAEKKEAQIDSLERAAELFKEVKKKEEDDCLTAYVLAEMALKKSLKDPDSYEEIDHESYVVKDDPGVKAYIQVVINYRAKNSFGGFVVNKKYFDFSKNLNLIDTFDK